MINLLPKTDNENQSLDKYRHFSIMVTHVVLIVYILYIASMSGLMLFGDQRQKSLVADISNLETQLSRQSKSEALILNLDATQNAIDQFIASRANTAAYLQNLNSRPATVSISSWTYLPGGNSRIIVQSKSHKDLEEYTQILRQKFPASMLEQAVTKGGVWNSAIVLK